MAHTGDDWMTPPPAPVGGDIERAAFTRGVESLAGEVRGLRAAVDSDRRVRKLLVVLIVLVTVGYGGLYARLLGVSSVNQRNGRILVECTTPSRVGERHECWEAAQANQRAAINQIVDANHNGVVDTEEIIAYLQGRKPITP